MLDDRTAANIHRCSVPRVPFFAHIRVEWGILGLRLGIKRCGMHRIVDMLSIEHVEKSFWYSLNVLQ